MRVPPKGETAKTSDASITRPSYWGGWNLIRETKLSTPQKGLLFLILGYANGESEWAFAQVETYAKDLSLSDRHIKTLLAELRQLGVLESRRCESRPRLSRRRKEHRIIWETLRKFHVPRHCDAQQHGNSGSPIAAQHGNQSSPKQGNCDSRPKAENGNSTSRTTPIALNSMNINTIHGEDGVLKFAEGKSKRGESDGHARNCGGWPMNVTAETLNSLTQLRILWEHALARAWVNDCDRLRFFTLACYCRRRELDGVIKSAGAAFTGLLRKRKWFGEGEDEERARIAEREIRELTSTLAPTAQPPPSVASDRVQKRTQRS